MPGWIRQAVEVLIDGTCLVGDWLTISHPRQTIDGSKVSIFFGHGIDELANRDLSIAVHCEVRIATPYNLWSEDISVDTTPDNLGPRNLTPKTL